MLRWAYPRKMQSTVFGPSLRFFGMGMLNFAKHPQVRKYESDGFCNTPEFITNSKCPLFNQSQSQNRCCDLHNVVDITVIAINRK
jgi:hypothetical protein